jgi:hypothetical protein
LTACRPTVRCARRPILRVLGGRTPQRQPRCALAFALGASCSTSQCCARHCSALTVRASLRRGASARPTARAWCGGPSGLRPLLEAHHVHTTTATRLEYRAAHNERTSSLKCVLFSLPRCAECATTSMACFVERYHWLTQMYIYLITANCFLVFASRVCTASTAVFEKCMPPPIGLCGVSNCSANDRKVVFI